MTHVLDITASNGVPFRVVLYVDGINTANPHRSTPGTPLVDFFDRRWMLVDHPEHGQFTGGHYYADVIRNRPRGVGLNIAGDVPTWTIDGESMILVIDWLALQLRNLAS